jgi:CubicO group peptidase (beta-lactamase class C family)
MKKVIKKFIIILAMMVNSVFIVNLSGQNTDKLPRRTPESEGVSSAGIVDFLNAVDTGRVELHSFMFIRHGKVIAEGWWNPYGSDYKHIMFSASKTFTATAIGLAVSENRLRITDKVISFFPYSLPDSISDYMREMTVQNLLTMSVGQDQEPRRGRDDDWIRSFIATVPAKEPGTVFKYNNTASFMLSAIVQQLTGQTVFDYLQPRIFKPLAIRGIDWDLNPQGINLGMIGLRLHTEDMAKFGQLLLQNGVWSGKQLVPKEWVKEATSYKIESNDGGANRAPKNLNDWAQGYCYQMWRGKNNSVRLDGMGGQFVVLFPDKDAIVVLTANANSTTQNELDLVHNYLIPAIKSDKALPGDPGLNNELQKRLASLSLKPTTAAGLPKSDIESKISGKEFALPKNSNNIQSVYFVFNGKECGFAIKRDDIISVIKAGLESWKISNTLSSSLLAPPQIASKSADANYKILQQIIKVGASYSWTDKNTLELTARFIEESLGSETIVCTFSEVNGAVSVSIAPKAAVGRLGAAPTGRVGPMGPAVTPLRGTLVKID